jgi:hypothetical protein
MFSIDLESKRTRLAIRFFTYGVMTVATIVISAVALLFALGYRFDNDNLTFEQGALLQFRSVPEGADVFVNGKKREKTPSKLTVAAGQHNVHMKLRGYHDWSTSARVEAGQLLWLNYARFIPTELKTIAARQFDTLHGALSSQNRQFIIMQPASNQPIFIIADIRDEEQPKYVNLTIPATVFTPRVEQDNLFTLVEWSLSGRFILVRHTAPGINELIRIDRERPQEAINISAKYGQIGEAHFTGNNANNLIGLIGSELQRFDIQGQNSEVLGEGIISFTLYKDDLVGFIADRNAGRLVGVLDDKRETIVRTYPPATPVIIDITNYFTHNYLAIANGQGVEVIRDPEDTTSAADSVFVKFSIDAPAVQWLYFSNSGRMIVAQHQGKFTTYDLELSKETTHDFKNKGLVTRPFEWLDDYYLWNDNDNTLKIVEFNGENERNLGAVKTGFYTTLSEDGRGLFSFGQNIAVGGKIELQRSDLFLGDN